MSSDQGIQTPLPQSAFARLATAARYAISGVAPTSWFGPQQPLKPMAPPEVKGRQFDYPFGINIDYTPRSTSQIGFAELRALADALPLLRMVIETRKDQIAGGAFSVRLRDPAGDAAAAAPRIKAALDFLNRPDRRHSFDAWLRMLLEDMLVIDAATIYPRLNRAGTLYSLDIIDGATITPLVGEDGRAPEPPDPAYQQILHGIPAADFSTDELLYLPRNARVHRLYGMSPVEQIALTVNIALRRDSMTLDYYRAGSLPDSFATLPKEWNVDQIGQFQEYFDALMSGNSTRRRMLKFMPADFRVQEVRQPPLKDQYDEWLARLICYAFSVPVSPFVSAVNRATSETLRLQASQEGLIPLRAWIKNALDRIIQTYLGAADLEFVWVGDDAVDPLQQAQTLQILVGAGIKTKDEARAELGLAVTGGKELGKFNPYHDHRGRFTTADGNADESQASATAARTPDTLGPRGLDSHHPGGSTAINFTPRMATISSDIRRVNISCADLRESDHAICQSIAFEDDHHYRGLCMEGVSRREQDCLEGRELSPLLPY
jgi:Phage portal protein